MKQAESSVRRGPYVCLAAQCDMLGYVGHTPHSFAFISADTVTSRTVERIRFDTPTPHDIQRIEQCLTDNNTTEQSSKDVREEDGQSEVPTMRVLPLTSEAMWPSLHSLLQKASEAQATGQGSNPMSTNTAATQKLTSLALQDKSDKLMLLPPRSTLLPSGPQLARDAYRYDFHHRLPTYDTIAGVVNTDEVKEEDMEDTDTRVAIVNDVTPYIVHPSLLRRIFLQALLILQLPNRSPAARFALHALHTAPDLSSSHDNNSHTHCYAGLLRFSVLPTAAASTMPQSSAAQQPDMYELRTNTAPSLVTSAQEGNVVRGHATCVRVDSNTTKAASVAYSTFDPTEMNAMLTSESTSLQPHFTQLHYKNLDELLSTHVLPHLLTHHVPTTSNSGTEETQVNASALLGALQRSAFTFYACVAHCTWCETVARVVSEATVKSTNVSSTRLSCLTLLSDAEAQGTKKTGGQQQQRPWQSLLLFAPCKSALDSDTNMSHTALSSACLAAWRVMVLVTGCDATVRWRFVGGSVTEGTLDALSDMLRG